MNREVIYQALFNLIAPLTWGNGQTFAFASRRVKMFSEIPAWPAMCQAEHDESVVERTGVPTMMTLGAVWLLYHAAGKDRDAIPATESNAMLQAVDLSLIHI